MMYVPGLPYVPSRPAPARDSHTLMPSGFDLNNGGQVAGGNDAFGLGAFEDQCGMAILSKYPIDTENMRTFQWCARHKATPRLRVARRTAIIDAGRAAEETAFPKATANEAYVSGGRTWCWVALQP